MNQTATLSGAELLELRERLRLARDHMEIAQREFEGALTNLGKNVVGWLFALPEACRCGETPTVSVLEIYDYFASITHRCKVLYQDVDEASHDAQIKAHKRGSKRKDYMDLGGGHIELTARATLDEIYTEVFPGLTEDLPTINKAPKEAK